MSMDECMFHGIDCPAARELAGLDEQINMRLKAEADADRLAEQLEEERERFYEKALAWRGIDFKQDACQKCGGSGVVTYGSTATWAGGIGGQAMTTGVCDQCWGSGDKNHKWADLRIVRAALKAHEEGKNG